MKPVECRRLIVAEGNSGYCTKIESISSDLFGSFAIATDPQSYLAIIHQSEKSQAFAIRRPDRVKAIVCYLSWSAIAISRFGHNTAGGHAHIRVVLPISQGMAVRG